MISRMDSPSTTRRDTLGILGLLLSLCTACTPQLLAYEAALQTQGEVHLYLQPMPQETHRLAFNITEISAIRDDGVVVQLRGSVAELECKKLLKSQTRLASARVPPGSYRGLSLKISTASLLGEDGVTALLVPEEPLIVEHEFTVLRKRASALFLSLHPENMVRSGFSFTPTLSLATRERQLTSLLGFATSSRKNLVSVFNKYTMEVVDTIATSSGPKDAVLDQRKGWVYIALAGADAIEAIEVTSGEILGRITLNFGDEPVEIALSPDGRTLVSVNYGSHTASIVDTASLREVTRIGLPAQPTSVVVAPSQPRAYVLYASSNALSVIDLATRGLAETVTIEEAPVRAAISGDGSRLYVITRNSPNLLVVNPESLAITNRIFIGVGASSVTVDRRTGLIYAGKNTGDVSVIDPSELVSIDEFMVAGNAAFLAIDNDQNSIFVVLPDTHTIQKLDLVSKRPLGAIEVEEGLYAVVVMGER